jgi:DNA polymerase III epsilon subunit-like protein
VLSLWSDSELALIADGRNPDDQSFTLWPGLSTLLADGWNPVKQWRKKKGQKGGGQFIEMPDVIAHLPGREIKARLGQVFTGKMRNVPVVDKFDYPENDGWQSTTGPDGRPALLRRGSIMDRIPDEIKPIEYVYRAISEEEWNEALERGYIESDKRMNLTDDEGTVTDAGNPSWYLPNGLGMAGRIIRIKYDPEDGWRRDHDSYIKTDEPIPISRIDAVTDWTIGTGGSHSKPETVVKDLAWGVENTLFNQLNDVANVADRNFDREEYDRIVKIRDHITSLSRAMTKRDEDFTRIPHTRDEVDAFLNALERDLPAEYVEDVISDARIALEKADDLMREEPEEPDEPIRPRPNYPMLWGPKYPTLQGDALQRFIREDGQLDVPALQEFLKNSDVVALDFETSGLDTNRRFSKTPDASRDRPVEVSAVPFKNGEEDGDAFDTRMNPGKPINPAAARVTGITDEVVKDAPIWTSQVPELLRAIGDRPVVAQNGVFDIELIKDMIDTIQNPDRESELPEGIDVAALRQQLTDLGATDVNWMPPGGVIDTLALARGLHGEGRNKQPDAPRDNKLGTLAQHYGVELDNAHAASADAKAAVGVLGKMLEKAEADSKNIPVLQQQRYFDKDVREFPAKLQAHLDALPGYEEAMREWEPYRDRKLLEAQALREAGNFDGANEIIAGLRMNEQGANRRLEEMRAVGAQPVVRPETREAALLQWLDEELALLAEDEEPLLARGFLRRGWARMSKAERSAKAKKQLRDPGGEGGGRWIEEGRKGIRLPTGKGSARPEPESSGAPLVTRKKAESPRVSSSDSAERIKKARAAIMKETERWAAEHGFTADSLTDEAGVIHQIIQDADGKYVADFARTLRDPNHIHTNWVKVAPQHQGGGLTRGLNEQLDKIYAEHGIEKNTLIANIDVGAFSWARSGYDYDWTKFDESNDPADMPLDPAVVKQRTDAVLKDMVRAGTFSRREARAMKARVNDYLDRMSSPDPEDRPIAAELAEMGSERATGEGKGKTWFGKQLLTGDDAPKWAGVKQIRPTEPEERAALPNEVPEPEGEAPAQSKRAARGAPSSAEEVRKRVEEVKSRMPSPEEFGRMTWEELDARLAEADKRASETAAARKDMLAAQRDGDREASLEAAKRVLGKVDPDMSDEDIRKKVDDAVSQAAKNYSQIKVAKLGQRPGAAPPLDIIGDRLGRNARQHLGLVLEAGRVLSEEIENRIAAGMPEVDPEELAALQQKAKSFGRAAMQAYGAYAEVLKAHQKAPTRATATALDEAQEKYLRINNVYKRISARVRYMEDPENFDEDSPEYRQAQRDYALEVLNEIRPMGGEQKYNVTSAQGLTLDEVEQIMQEAGDLFPTDWHDARRDHMGPRGTSITTGGRGGHSDQAGRITISKAKGDALKVKEDSGWSNAAAHELAHGMQAALPQIRTAEQLFSLLRSPGGMEQLMKIYADLQEMGYADRWADPYIGKVYGGSVNGRGKETITTGVQALFFGDRYFSRSAANGGFDYQFRAFLLGLLATQ